MNIDRAFMWYFLVLGLAAFLTGCYETVFGDSVIRGTVGCLLGVGGVYGAALIRSRGETLL